MSEKPNNYPTRDAPYITPATLDQANDTAPLPDIPAMLAELCTCAGEKPTCIYCESRAEIEAGRRACQLAQTDLTRLRAEVKRLERLAYVPGAWRCAKCQCGLVSTSLHLPDGSFSANTEPHTCPNGCGPMWRVTEREAGNQACERVTELQSERGFSHEMEGIAAPIAVSDLLAECARRFASDVALSRPHPLWGAIEAYENARAGSGQSAPALTALERGQS